VADDDVATACSAHRWRGAGIPVGEPVELGSVTSSTSLKGRCESQLAGPAHLEEITRSTTMPPLCNVRIPVPVFIDGGGFELVAALGGAALVLAAVGAHRFSVDAAIAARRGTSRTASTAHAV